MALVGAGVAAQALQGALRQAGWPVLGIAMRDPQSARERAAAWGLEPLGSPTQPEAGLRQAPLVILAVRDDAIREVAAALAASAAPWTGRVVLHLSGARPSAEAEPLRAQGAAVGSWHPLATLSVAQSVAPGIPFFCEGDEAALEICRQLTGALGGRFHLLSADAKPAYHAAATLAGNLVAVLLAGAAGVLRSAGVDAPEQALAWLSRASLEGALAQPGHASLTGPVARADAGTLADNVHALASQPAAIRAAHAALSLAANAALLREGRGEPGARRAIEELLHRELQEAVSDLTHPPGNATESR